VSNSVNINASSCKGIIVAAPSSGSGKTLLALGLLRALACQGTNVTSVKIGPDYIDPAFHSAATGRPCVNLDPWAMRADLRHHVVNSQCQAADLIVCEGVMGLFDGATAREGSTADIAAATGWPVILVVDARAQAASAAAVVRGFADLRRDVTIGGIIFNRVSSVRHSGVIGDAMAHYVPEIPVLGYLPRDDGLSLPSRHLGLVQASEHDELEAFLDQAARLVAEHLDMEALTGMATPASTPPPPEGVTPIAPLGQRIAVAHDRAFAFSYAHILDGWRCAGAEIQLFSPLGAEAPAEAANAVYLPGGYPELHADVLAGGQVFLTGLRRAAEREVRVFGECGGYMVLGEGIIDAEGTRHAMAGLLPLETSFAKPSLHLGYRHVRMANQNDANGGLIETEFRGHEFHYATIVHEEDANPLFRMSDATGADLGAAGLSRGTVAGSFIHLVDQYA
jgi:cobyrinic acid a,c-diamide synthase